MYVYTIDDSHEAYDIYVNLISSPAGHYLSRSPHIIGLLKELLATQKLTGSKVVIQRDMGRNIGRTDVVATTQEDTIYYAKAVKSEAFLRFVRNRSPQISSVLTVTVVHDDEGNYEVDNVWIGTNHPAFPGEEDETADSKTYWQNHALVQDAIPIQSKTITKVCPY